MASGSVSADPPVKNRRAASTSEAAISGKMVEGFGLWGFCRGEVMGMAREPGPAVDRA